MRPLERGVKRCFEPLLIGGLRPKSKTWLALLWFHWDLVTRVLHLIRGVISLPLFWFCVTLTAKSCFHAKSKMLRWIQVPHLISIAWENFAEMQFCELVAAVADLIRLLSKRHRITEVPMKTSQCFCDGVVRYIFFIFHRALLCKVPFVALRAGLASMPSRLKLCRPVIQVHTYSKTFKEKRAVSSLASSSFPICNNSRFTYTNIRIRGILANSFRITDKYRQVTKPSIHHHLITSNQISCANYDKKLIGNGPTECLRQSTHSYPNPHETTETG